MTTEEAIKTIEVAIAEVEWDYPMDYAVALEMAIEALKEQSKIVPCKDCEYYDNKEGIGWCDLNSFIYPSTGEWNSFDETDYCSFGERKKHDE